MGDPRGPLDRDRASADPDDDVRQLREEVARLRGVEEALRWTRQAADKVPEAMFRVDVTGRLMDVNRAACEMHGWTREELIGQRVRHIDAGPAGEWSDFWNRLRAARRLVFESINRRRDGSTFPTRIDASMLVQDGSEQCVGVVHDLTEQRRRDAIVGEIARGVSAKTGRTFFRLLLEHLARVLGADYAFVGELVPGDAGRMRTISLLVDGVEQPNIEYDLAGTPCEYVVDRSTCSYPAGVQELFPKDRLLVEMGAVGYVGTPLFHSNGEALGLLVILTRKPIEVVPQAESLLQIFGVRAAAELERLRAQQALQQSESLLRNVIDHTKAVVFVKRADGRYLLVNREYERLSGVTLEQVRDKLDHDILPREVADTVRANDLEVLSRRTPIQYEEEVPTAEGELRTYLAVKVPLFDATGEPWAVCGISTDITDRKHLELQLRQMQRLESVGLLAGGVAHDFNNLLTAIQGYTDLAMFELGPSHPTRPLLSEVQGASRRAAGLTRQLLAFARRQDMAPRRVELPDAVEDVNALLRPLIGERITPVVRLDPDLWAVHFDPGQLEQVLVNLAVNARDAMPEGGTLTYEAANATLAADGLPAGSGLAPGEYVRLVVRDTGTGMTPEVMARIFEPFFTTKGPGKGTGVGLATCHGIMKQGGGHIGVASEPGVGSAFTLLLPRSPDDATAPEAPRSELIQQGHGTVMLVEDEPYVRSLAARALRSAGYAVVEAACGEDALAQLGTGGPEIDVLLTDVVMPGMNGPELADRVSALRPGVGVLFTTGYAEEALRERLRATGALLLEKPYAPAALTVAVREAFAARH